MENKEFLDLHNLVAPIKARKKIKRVGRGESSGFGKTSTRGHKGQKARKSGNVRPGFEGGQNPLARRLPKRGFKNSLFKKNFQIVNLSQLEQSFNENDNIDKASLIAKGIINKIKLPVKLLAFGDLNKKVNITVDAASKKAFDLIKVKGGQITLVNSKKSV